MLAEDIIKKKKMTHFQLTSRYILNLFHNIPLFEFMRVKGIKICISNGNEMIHRGINKVNVNYTSLLIHCHNIFYIKKIYPSAIHKQLYKVYRMCY